ncbi:Presenilin/signal peptide peptidase [Lasallia pustulata]|uniref:Presenilin/signal peptide peptidase n=1 Tax=Lasallia pustulata TaxID=136370 RepID=A0A1W5DBR1_9LECA|nr:Presenilin/signal peptide peptidase [Lasallia pustulata]
MAPPGPTMEFLGRVAYEFSLVQPYIPTYLHLLVSALFPIYTGAHASLSRPSSAAEPPKRTERAGDESDDDEDLQNEQMQKMEGLSPTDAIVFPLLAGSTLAGLYFLIKWLNDPILLNKILNWYLSIFGILSVARLLTDIMGVATSFVFPARYSDDGVVWVVKPKQRVAVSKSLNGHGGTPRATPLPGILSMVRLPPALRETLWTLRALPSQKVTIRAYVRSVVEANIPIGLQGMVGLMAAILAGAYFNLVAKPWWLTNLLGFGFSYSALQYMSPTTFWTGTLILSSLFFYDIYFVFFTPMMVTVATKLDIPIKLLFPRPTAPDADPGKLSLSMLGLGDVVLPGIMIGLALRFDLYLFYLRKQTRRVLVSHPEEKDATEISTKDIEPTEEVLKAKWRPATGGWGERLWLGSTGIGGGGNEEGGAFPKTYFHASLFGYVLGMLCTLGVMHVYGHAQPALLYLVPSVLGSLWGTALVKGDINTMWTYTEAVEGEEPKGESDAKAKPMDSIFSLSRAEKTAKRLEKDLVQGAKAKEDDKSTKEGSKEKSNFANSFFARDRKRELFFFSVTLPPLSQQLKQDTNDSETQTEVKAGRTLEEELRIASESNLAASAAESPSASSGVESPVMETIDGESKRPALKRRRRK